MRYLLLAITLMACTTARDIAVERFGKEVACVESSGHLAYCNVRGVGYICDRTSCVPAPSAPQVMLEMDADRQRQEDEDQQQMNNNTMMMNQ